MAADDDPTEVLGRGLEPALAEALGDEDLVVHGLERLSGGASRETWSLVARGPSVGERDLILQRLRPGGTGGGPSMEVEDRLLAAARAAGVPVPDTVLDAARAEAAGLGPARVAARVPGEALGPRLVRAERSEDERRALARQLGAALAGINRVDPTTVHELEVAEPLDRVRDGLDLLDERRPALELGLRRLAATRPEQGPEAVVHGDFRVGNLLIDDSRLTAVLDWELAHRGDPVEDLGWICGRAWRFGGDREAGGLVGLDDLLAGYADAGGRPVSVEAVRWWTAAGTLLWGLICAVQARRHLDGLVRSVELAAIGRRVCEAEYDLLDLVLDDGGAASTDAPDKSPSPAPLEGAGGLHGRPTAAELVEAVRGHLAEEVAPGLEGSARFHTRVAAHALDVVERELRLCPAQQDAHASRLAAIGFADDVALARAIRSDDLDDRPDVDAAVRASVVDRPRVANPRWLHPPDA
ncbi:hypothetical protein BH24ACT4_BH24ACT4_19300 [soil metagenome]